LAGRARLCSFAPHRGEVLGFQEYLCV
jgi:hypothetical protein